MSGIDDAWEWDEGGDTSRRNLEGPEPSSADGGTPTASAMDSDDQIDIVEDTAPLLAASEDRRSSGTMGSDDLSRPVLGTPSHTTQYITAVAATLGALSMGTILGYSSPAGAQLAPNITVIANVTNGTSECDLIGGVALTTDEKSWFSATVNIGALIGAPLGGFCMNFLGRRWTMIATIAPFLLGWILVGLASNFAMLVSGRIFCGMCCGLVSLSVPTYLGEIASNDIRGLLGTGFQLMVTVGILYSYAVGAGVCWQLLALISLIPSIIFSISMFFSKESPVFLLAKNKTEDAIASLQFFRGKDFNIEPELRQLTASKEAAEQKKASFRDLKTPYILKPLLISLSLMFFQQASGVNAILFNLTTIFESAHVDLSADASSIIIAVVQVIATCVGAVLMDKAGRKLLLIVSSAAMCLSLVAMGTYFYMQDHEKADSLGWLPLTSLIIFISAFSFGLGPIPWLMMGELFSVEVREVASTLATLTNWLLSFIITLIFDPLRKAIHDQGVYWLFAIVCGGSFFFSIFVIKETKGKSIEEITYMFGGPAPDTVNIERKSSRSSSKSSSSSEGLDNKGYTQ